MKCKNCGYELKETDKFCNECGAKVEKEQLGDTTELDNSVNTTNINESTENSNKNENQLQGIQIKCPCCGGDTPQSQRYCKNCGAELNIGNHDNKKSNTPPIYKNPKIWIIFAIVFILAVFFIVLAVSQSKDNNDNFTYKNYALGNMSYKVPDTWKYSDYDDGNYHYDSKNNLLTVYATDFDEEINEENSESFINGLVYADGMSEVTEISKDFTYICSKKALHYIYTCEISNKDMYMNVYAFSKDGYLYGFLFGSYGHKQSDEFNATETDIIDSIRFDSVSKYTKPTLAEPTTEEPTTIEPTTVEPTTVKPTESPTEKPTERKIKNNTSTDNFWAEGSGDYVATGLKVTGYGVLHIEYYGEGNFSVISYENDNYDDLLVNEIGNYSGDVLVDHSGTFELEISAEGSWKITSSGLSVDDVTSFSGTGDCVTGLTSHGGGTWEISHNGDSNFAVIEYGLNEGYMDLLVNEIGDYNGTVKVESGDDIFFKVSADGAWSIKKK